MIRVFTLPFDPKVCGFDDSDFRSFLSEVKVHSANRRILNTLFSITLTAQKYLCSHLSIMTSNYYLLSWCF